jgi:tRNA(Arg) A34 adenosine deaminase TadA
MSDHSSFLERAIQLAQLAVSHGNHPFGALLVVKDKIVLEAENTVFTDHDVTRHAELNLVSRAARELSPADLKEAILYTSTEPCAMCSGAIFWSGIRNVVYACSAERLEEIANGKFMIPCREVFARAEEKVHVEGPLLEELAVQAHLKFWPFLVDH